MRASNFGDIACARRSKTSSSYDNKREILLFWRTPGSLAEQTHLAIINWILEGNAAEAEGGWVKAQSKLFGSCSEVGEAISLLASANTASS